MSSSQRLVERACVVCVLAWCMGCAADATPTPLPITARAMVAPLTKRETVTPTMQPLHTPSSAPSPLVAYPLATPTLQTTPTSASSPIISVTAARSTPPTTPLPTHQTGVRIREETLNLWVYPYAKHLTWGVDGSTGVSYATLNRAAYEAAHESPQRQAFKAVHLENELLDLVFLPELGGRLYQAYYKPTQQSIFYNNPVVKPSRWGPFESDKNWWLALGGMEWAVPVQEHGYEWGSVWIYRTHSDGETGSVTLRDSDAANRLQTTITVMLRRGEAAWTIAPQLHNPTTRPMRAQFWLNAMLTLGAATIAPDTEFVLPTHAVKVHSTGDQRLPSEKQTMPWPQYQNINLSTYRNWQNWLGVFANDLNGQVVSAYNPQSKLGITRTFPADKVAGVKLFAFGPQFPDRSYTDDQSQYFELWGGPNKTFWTEDDVRLTPNMTLTWSERWTLVASR